jgi:hypothetical protein
MTVLLAESVASARTATVLILNSSHFAADERRLEEALRIYTQDMGIRIIIEGDAPVSVENDALDALARQAQEEGADVVVWTSRRSDGTAVYYVLSVHERDLRETEIANPAGSRAAETVALKIRTILVRQRLRPATDAAEGTGASPPPSRPPRETGGSSTPNGGDVGGDHASAGPVKGPSSPAPAPTPARSAGDAPRERPPANGATSAPAPSARPRRWPLGSFEVAYSAAFPFDGAWHRQGLTVTAEVRLGRESLHAFVDGTLSSRSQASGTNFTVNLRDLPFGAGMLWRWELDRLSLAAGPRASLHLIEAQSMLSDGNAGSARQWSAGLGAVGRVEVRWLERVRFGLGVAGEALLPARTFTAAGTPAIRTGAAQLGILAGVALLIP